MFRTIDFLDKCYDKNNYNCAHFASDMWHAMTGFNISENLSGFTKPIEDRKMNIKQLRSFKKLDKPITPCIVLFNNKHAENHVGIYIEGSLFHIRDKGVILEPLEIAKLRLGKMGFYDVKPINNS